MSEMKKVASNLSFSIENILREDEHKKKVIKNKPLIEMFQGPNSRWDFHQRSTITTLVKFCGSYLESVKKDCKCECEVHGNEFEEKIKSKYFFLFC